MQERKFTDKEVYQRSALLTVVMFIVLTVLIDIIIGLVAAFITILFVPYLGKQVKVEK